MTDAQVKKLREIANDVWGGIGDDYLQAFCGDADSPNTINREEVLEAVCDAERLAEMCRREAPEIAELISHDVMPYEELLEILRPGFPYEEYGW